MRSILVDETPQQQGLPFALWNRRAVMELLEKRFGVAMPIRTGGEYLSRWGYTPQRPLKRALEQRPAEVQRWLEETYPTILDRAKTEKALMQRQKRPWSTGVMRPRWSKMAIGYAVVPLRGTRRCWPPRADGLGWRGCRPSATRASSGSALSSRP